MKLVVVFCSFLLLILALATAPSPSDAQSFTTPSKPFTEAFFLAVKSPALAKAAKSSEANVTHALAEDVADAMGVSPDDVSIEDIKSVSGGNVDIRFIVRFAEEKAAQLLRDKFMSMLRNNDAWMTHTKAVLTAFGETNVQIIIVNGRIDDAAGDARDAGNQALGVVQIIFIVVGIMAAFALFVAVALAFRKRQWKTRREKAASKLALSVDLDSAGLFNNDHADADVMSAQVVPESPSLLLSPVSSPIGIHMHSGGSPMLKQEHDAQYFKWEMGNRLGEQI